MPIDETKIILLLHFIANIIFIVDAEALVLQSIVSLRALQIPELVEKRIVTLLLECFHDRVQVLLGLEPLHFIVRIQYLYVDDSFSSLDGANYLLGDAVGNEKNLHHQEVAKVSPRDAQDWIERRFGVVRYKVEQQMVEANLLLYSRL